MRRVVVTGMGVVAPNGVGRKAFSEALRAGRVAIAPLRRDIFNSSRAPRERYLAAEIPPHTFSLNGLDRHITYGLMAAEEAMRESGLSLDAVDPEECGIVFSSSKGGMETWEKGITPRFIDNFLTSSASSVLLKKYPFRGPALNLVSACATGTHTIIRAAQLIQDNYASVMMAGASDASMTPLLLSGYDQMGVLSHEGVFPFDRRRSGFVIGEGAAAVILEERDEARRRGAVIYGEIIGYAMGEDPSHPLRYNPDDHCLARCLTLALNRSHISCDQLDYMNAHGTATVAGDLYETEQIKRSFGKQAYAIPVSSTKSMTGHLLGASGAVEFVASLLAIEEKFIPPTVGLQEKDPACDLDYVPNIARQKKVKTALSISMGFGGHISVIVVKK